jgi:hypothetical protein
MRKPWGFVAFEPDAMSTRGYEKAFLLRENVLFIIAPLDRVSAGIKDPPSYSSASLREAQAKTTLRIVRKFPKQLAQVR